MKKIILSFFLLISISIFLINCNNKKYIINFETNGSFDIDTIELSNIDDFILPKVVNKEGYKFVGWYLDSNFSEEFNKLSEETYNYTLYAKWEVLSYVINYDLDGGSCDDLVLSFTHKEEITLPTPEKEGHLFLGWYETVDGVEVKVETISNRDYNLKAKWEVLSYVINYDLDGGSCDNLITSFNHNEEIMLPTPEKDGYNFLGWYETVDDAEVKVEAISNKDYNLIAKWEIMNYVITYDLDGGTCDNLITSFNHNEEISLPTPEKEGYIFLGWYENIDGVEVKVETISNRHYNLIAKWKIKSYIINYDLDGGTCDNLITSFNHNEEITLPTPEKERYKFLGWYETIDYVEVKVETIYNKTYNLKAKWEKELLFLQFQYNNIVCAFAIKNNISTAYDFLPFEELDNNEIYFDKDYTILYNGEVIKDDITLYLRSENDMDYLINDLNKESIEYYLYESNTDLSWYIPNSLDKYAYNTSSGQCHFLNLEHSINHQYKIEVQIGSLLTSEKCQKKVYIDEQIAQWYLHDNSVDICDINLHYMYITIYKDNITKGYAVLKSSNTEEFIGKYKLEFVNFFLILDYNNRDMGKVENVLKQLFNFNND